MLKKLFTDPGFIFLAAINIYCIWYYQQNPGQFDTLVWLYWGQSVLIGLFNFADMITIPKIIPGSMSMNNQPLEDSRKAKGCAAFFFACHYGFFHLVYAIFLAVQTKSKIDTHFIMIGLAVFAANLIIQFIRQKQWESNHPVNIGTMFFLPYLRIIPMHLMILVPAFLHITPSIIFLFLKTFADVLMYVISLRLYKDSAALNKTV